MLPRVLTIAGSDSGGGAGIQADLKTFTALGCFGMTAITAITAQNTRGVQGVHVIPPGEVARQMTSVLDDIGVDVIKTGMLPSAETIETVVVELCKQMKPHGDTTGDPHETDLSPKLVVDPVMVATSGDSLITEDARKVLQEKLLPLTYVVTPNIPEAEALSGISIESEATLRQAAEAIYALGPQYVLIKGGHLQGADAIDWLFNGVGWQAFSAPRVNTKNTHGTGCTFAAAIAALLAQGLEIGSAVQGAKDYLTGALKESLSIGAGHGPVNHMWNIQPPSRADD
jgi:hydroxymethylpyrimidine/phosphomethylpyrimidine kinase